MENRQAYYNKIIALTEKARDHIANDLDGNYKGYIDANAVSLYLDDTYNINVTCDNEAERAFNDVLSI